MAWYGETIKTLYTNDQLQTRIAEMGKQISADYVGKDLVLLCILKGSFMFAADLARSIDLPLRGEFLGDDFGTTPIEGTGDTWDRFHSLKTRIFRAALVWEF